VTTAAPSAPVGLDSIGPQDQPHLQGSCSGRPWMLEADPYDLSGLVQACIASLAGRTLLQGNAGLKATDCVTQLLARTQLEAALPASIEADAPAGGKQRRLTCPLDRRSKPAAALRLPNGHQSLLNPGNTR